MVAADSAVAQIPRQDPKSCKGQPEIKPLEPLQLRTDKGVSTFQVEIADSEMEREYGLMCRRALAADRGMLFLFARETPQMFWMRNTLIPLDIVYIGANGRVVSISRNVQPLDESGAPSSGPAKFVLELAAGRAAQIGLLPGDRVTHRAMPRG
ncbi:MAG: DUF192 domain-containing protein [Alphaproteobacteria bacterium]|nr:DUF192 domain-containing protein [Alphaproteobacteria bacterium]MBU1513682.1 DUF192 domain-containing protein [Alphaproteobacteria bacterium]MBU2094673.1 DUF192 domain-containing protein [Alphaproteobacteria bacterium]MBU2150258.1 DUF192 domain-containing protein [Alphaproteobacteria bacterium]MBU2309213.1 DUF192 domain-containing protein [Alphaproteobacteria bacterium]